MRLVVLIAMIVWPSLAPDPGAPGREVRLVMGATAEVHALGLADPSPALAAAFAVLDRIDARLTLYRESELTRLNDSGAGVVSSDLGAVLGHALEVAAASDGAFDPTVEPLVRAVGGLGGPPRSVSEAERRRLLARVGYRRVHLDAAAGHVRLEPGTRLDFGGIAKGYAADQTVLALRAAGAAAGLVDLGGSSLSVFGEEVVVDVRDPLKLDAPPWASFRVKDGAVSSSGGDQRPGHILDPRTGRSVGNVLTATVVAPTGIEADALSTAVFVLGADEGLRLLGRRGVHGLVLIRERGRRVIRATRGFVSAFGLEAAQGVAVRE